MPDLAESRNDDAYSTVGAVLGYLIIGILVGLMMYCLGEVGFVMFDSGYTDSSLKIVYQMMVYDPSAGGFIEFATRYVDPALGFAVSDAS